MDEGGFFLCRDTKFVCEMYSAWCGVGSWYESFGILGILIDFEEMVKL